MILSQKIRIASIHIPVMVLACSLPLNADEPVPSTSATNAPPRTVSSIQAELRYVSGKMAEIKHEIQLEKNKAERLHPNIKDLQRQRANYQHMLEEAVSELPGVATLDTQIRSLERERDRLLKQARGGDPAADSPERLRVLTGHIQNNQERRIQLVQASRGDHPEVERLSAAIEGLDQRIQIAVAVLPRIKELQVTLDGWEYQKANLLKAYRERTARVHAGKAAPPELE